MAPSHRQGSTHHHGICSTSCGALAGMRTKWDQQSTKQVATGPTSKDGRQQHNEVQASGSNRPRWRNGYVIG